MNQIYRALHMPPKRLIKKLSGQKEIYTIAVRRAPKGDGCDPLPALGEEPYTPLLYPCSWTLTAIAEIVYFIHAYKDSMKIFTQPQPAEI